MNLCSFERRQVSILNSFYFHGLKKTETKFVFVFIPNTKDVLSLTVIKFLRHFLYEIFVLYNHVCTTNWIL